MHCDADEPYEDNDGRKKLDSKQYMCLTAVQTGTVLHSGASSK